MPTMLLDTDLGPDEIAPRSACPPWSQAHTPFDLRGMESVSRLPPPPGLGERLGRLVDVRLRNRASDLDMATSVLFGLGAELPHLPESRVEFDFGHRVIAAYALSRGVDL